MRRAFERTAMMTRACLSSTFVASQDGNGTRKQINNSRDIYHLWPGRLMREAFWLYVNILPRHWHCLSDGG
jgi:hypothetical protein